MVPVPGARVLIMDGWHRMIGAVGVTGDTSDNDEIAAIAPVSRPPVLTANAG